VDRGRWYFAHFRPDFQRGFVTVSGVGENGTGTGTYGIALTDLGQIAAPAITLIADSIDLPPDTSVDAGAGTVVVQPRTPGTQIDLGGADVPVGSPLTLDASRRSTKPPLGTPAVGLQKAEAKTSGWTIGNRWKTSCRCWPNNRRIRWRTMDWPHATPGSRSSVDERNRCFALVMRGSASCARVSDPAEVPTAGLPHPHGVIDW
jgi:hypothetical protein